MKLLLHTLTNEDITMNPELEKEGATEGQEIPVVEATPEEVATIAQMPTPNDEPVEEPTILVEVTSLEGFKSCMRCGRDESATAPLSIVGDKKLCSICTS